MFTLQTIGKRKVASKLNIFYIRVEGVYVKEIRYGTKYKDYTIQEFEVSCGTIQSVKENKTWKGI